MNDNYFGVIRWCEEDHIAALEDAGVEVTDENIEKLGAATRWMDGWRDRAIEHGNEFIQECASEMKEES